MAGGPPKPVRVELPVQNLFVTEHNPNKMNTREFDLLVENMQRVQVTDAILVFPLDLPLFKKVWAKHRIAVMSEEEAGPAQEAFEAELNLENLGFRIVGGHHRVQGAKYLEWQRIPCTVIVDAAFDQEEADIQLMRHNAIRGKLDPQAFFNLYEKYASKGYGEDVVQEMFGFADDAEFKKLIAQAAKSLPKEIQSTFKEAAEEIKTIDGLAKLLNRMFTQYGDTLPYGYLIVDYGSEHSIWLRNAKKTHDALQLLGGACMTEGKVLDDVVGALIQAAAKGEIPEVLTRALENAKSAKLPEGLTVLPTHENIEKQAAL